MNDYAMGQIGQYDLTDVNRHAFHDDLCIIQAERHQLV